MVSTKAEKIIYAIIFIVLIIIFLSLNSVAVKNIKDVKDDVGLLLSAHDTTMTELKAIKASVKAQASSPKLDVEKFRTPTQDFDQYDQITPTPINKITAMPIS